MGTTEDEATFEVAADTEDEDETAAELTALEVEVVVGTTLVEVTLTEDVEVLMGAAEVQGLLQPCE